MKSTWFFFSPLRKLIELQTAVAFLEVVFTSLFFTFLGLAGITDAVALFEVLLVHLQAVGG